MRPKDGSPSIPCHLIDEESIAVGSDWVEIEEYYERKQVDDQRAEVQDMESRAELDGDIEDIVAYAEELAAEAHAQAPIESKASRLNNINKNRQAEIEEMNEEYRRERFEELDISRSERPPLDSLSDVGEEYVPRPRFSNVLLIQDRRIKEHGEKK